MRCRSGGLVVYDGEDEFEKKLGSYCGQRFSWVLYTTSRYAYIRLQGVTWNMDEGRNIKMNYEAIGSTLFLILKRLLHSIIIAY